MADKTIKTAEAAADGEHALTKKIRDIVEHPDGHTVGELAAAVDQALSELMMFRERLDLLDNKDAGKAKGPKGSAPVSGPAATAPGTARRAS